MPRRGAATVVQHGANALGLEGPRVRVVTVLPTQRSNMRALFLDMLMEQFRPSGPLDIV